MIAMLAGPWTAPPCKERWPRHKSAKNQINLQGNQVHAGYLLREFKHQVRGLALSLSLHYHVHVMMLDFCNHSVSRELFVNGGLYRLFSMLAFEDGVSKSKAVDEFLFKTKNQS